MKKFFENISYIGCLLPMIVGAVLPVVIMCIRIWGNNGGNIGSFVVNILILPFAIIGAINIVRGFFAVIEKDGEKFYGEKYWKVAVYMLITIAGYAAVFYEIAQWIK